MTSARLPVVFLVFLVTVLIIPTDAVASIYKCFENGKTVFRDKPCKEGQGKKFNLGAVIENKDPTGTLGDVSGSWQQQGRTVSIRDALAILDRKANLLSIYLIPDRYTAAEVQHFQDNADESLLQNKSPAKHPGFSSYPYLNLRIQFKKGLPRNQENIDSLELVSYGIVPEEPGQAILDNAKATEAVHYLSMFEDISYGDVNLDSVGNKDDMDWKISIKAPIYYHALH